VILFFNKDIFLLNEIASSSTVFVCNVDELLLAVVCNARRLLFQELTKPAAYYRILPKWLVNRPAFRIQT